MPSISDAERSYIIGGAAAGVRSDGRGPLGRRPVTLETGVLPTASGSARVRVDGGAG
jgi:exosome complex component RRP42